MEKSEQGAKRKLSALVSSGRERKDSKGEGITGIEEMSTKKGEGTTRVSLTRGG